MNQDCQQCGACCRGDYDLVVTAADIASEPKLAAYFHASTVGDLRCKTPCPLLDGNRCSIQDTKPVDCGAFQPGCDECHRQRRREGLE